MFVDLFFLFAIILLAVISYFTGPPPGIPPGRWGIPFIGCLPKSSETVFQHIENLRKEYGDIFHVKMGSRLFVVLSEYNIVKTAFTNPNLQGRPDFYSLGVYRNFENKGLVFSEGSKWHNVRRFTLRHLRDFGMGKSSMDVTVQDEAKALVMDLEKNCEDPIELTLSLNCAVINVLWQLVAGCRYDVTDERMTYILKLTNDDFNDIQGNIMILDMFPALIPLVPRFIKDKYMKLDTMEAGVAIGREFYMEIIQEHQSTLDPENPRDYIDTFLMEINAHQDDPDSDYTLENLLVSLDDLFAAGSETSSSTLRWFVLYMALNPHIQEKVQRIIDEVVPQDRLPSIDDRDSLQYLEAVIHEVHRKSSLVAFGVYHRATQTTKINNYKIPKDTIVMQNTAHIHNDKAFWEKPDEFYPEHFIGENGRCLTKKDGFLPFSIGRRACLGETLARITLFIFAAALLQKFKISPPDGEILTTEPIDNPLLNQVKPYKIVLTKRF
ncbi:unnamed protein product [Meganyctiphanes norvegica]|uniref:Cytochrome P450 n=1 Tax=Meganyctiphanes norvegica TaxID=48144 RepID=A0AAV2R9I5_MEGNR